MQNNVILVDKKDNQIGVLEKLEAHKTGRLHRAFSIFIFNSKGQLLLQRRAKKKYHCGGLWTNTCCSHPRPGETIKGAAHRRLKEEMGFDCNLKEIHKFVYKTKFKNGLTENEYDHVLIGKFDDEPVVDREEAEDWEWTEPNSILEDIENNPEKYTFWFRFCLDEILTKVQNNLKI
jgi:isopentenyl-diphosphate delta-isomerase